MVRTLNRAHHRYYYYTFMRNVGVLVRRCVCVRVLERLHAHVRARPCVSRRFLSFCEYFMSCKCCTRTARRRSRRTSEGFAHVFIQPFFRPPCRISQVCGERGHIYVRSTTLYAVRAEPNIRPT